LIKKFLDQYSITTHSIATLVGSLVMFYNFNTQFRDTVISTYSHFPSYLKTVVELSIAYYAYYKTTRKDDAPAQAIVIPQLKGTKS
jgi:hypothetical protein